MQKKIIRNILATSLFVGSTSLALAAGSGVPGQKFIEEWDKNKDGVVTIEDVREHRADIFFTFDYDEDGYLTLEEYAYFDEARANNKADKQKDATYAALNAGNAAKFMEFEINDLDKDGRVSREEFIKNSEGFLKAKDRNGDGVIDSSDFGPQ